MTRVGSLIEDLAGQFGAAGLVFGHGTDSAWDEAVALVLAVTGCPDDRGALEQPVSEEHHVCIRALARRRMDERMPLPYLLGRCRFAGSEFLIEPGIVIPRSPIGGLIENQFAPWLKRAPVRVLDLCTGSGCIGIAVALAFPDARVDLADVSPQAVALARRNIAHHGLESRVAVHTSDVFDQLPPGVWDLIVTNPPYVDAPDMATLPPEYRHEPTLGLAGGRDGLDLVGRMLESHPERLDPAGTFVCEVGASAPALQRRYPRLPFLWPDLPHGGEGVFLLQGADLG